MIKRPLISEKSTKDFASSCYVLAITKETNKQELAKHLEKLYKIKVEDIRIVNLPAKKVRFRNLRGVRQNRAKAYIQLKKGQTIPGLEMEKPAESKEKGQEKVKEAAPETDKEKK